jgi:hypothetical protein
MWEKYFEQILIISFETNIKFLRLNIFYWLTINVKLE